MTFDLIFIVYNKYINSGNPSFTSPYNIREILINLLNKFLRIN
jgi:hypothetical protein